MEKKNFQKEVIDKALAVQKVPLAALDTLIKARTEAAKNGDTHLIRKINLVIIELLGL